MMPSKGLRSLRGSEEQRDLGVRTRFKRTPARRHDEGTERCKATDPCGYPVQETHRHQASKNQHGPSGLSQPIKRQVARLGLSRLMHNQPAAETHTNNRIVPGGSSSHAAARRQRCGVSEAHAMILCIE